MKAFQTKATRFLLYSLAALTLLCVCMFTFLVTRMNLYSRQSIDEVSDLYMSSMSQQISMHFSTAIGLRLDQLKTVESLLPPHSALGGDSTREELARQAQARNFIHMGAFTADGSYHTLYGEQVEISDPEPFWSSLSRGEEKIAISVDPQGEKVILLGIPTDNLYSDGTRCSALVAGLPISYITDTLSLEENDYRVYSFIIRKDGTFVIRTANAFRNSYFERVRQIYSATDDMTPQDYLTKLENAIHNGEDYSAECIVSGERRYVYCTVLPYSEWYLLTFMPCGTMDNIIRGLSGQWSRLALGCGGVMFLALLLVFLGYLWLSQEQLRALEKARSDAEAATRAKSDFLSNMSHDIRTPMNAIVGMTSIAVSHIDDKEEVQRCLKKISLSSKHLLGLINDVLDMSKIESGKMTLSVELVSLQEVLDSVVSIVQPQIHAKNQQFNVSIHDITAEHVYCDSVRINQVLLNLLSNAIKYTPDGGSIGISLWEEPSPMGEKYTRIQILVTDTGIGMSPEFQEKIFDSFVREDSARVRKTEGTGLGMAITKYIVDAMKGSIEVHSELGKGSQFQVTLDLESSDATESEMRLPPWNMLVVDDDRQLCESAVSALRDIGVNAEWALDAESAIDLVLRRHDAGSDYRIILLDWKLPGIDGIEAARRIRQQLGDDVPILLISAYDWGEIEEAARNAGITSFISKPLFKSTLYHGLKPYMLPESSPVESAGSSTDFLAGQRVLLAEDNELNWEIANELLTSELGLELDWAENGQVCLEKFQSSPVGYYKAILMDIRMPLMTGYEATRAIRALERPDSTLPIVAMTADAFAEDVKKCLDCGMNGHLAKPIDIREVSQLLTRLLKQ